MEELYFNAQAGQIRASMRATMVARGDHLLPDDDVDVAAADGGVTRLHILQAFYLPRVTGSVYEALLIGKRSACLR